MGRSTGRTGNAWGTPEGNPTERRGAPPSGSGAIVNGPFPYPIGRGTAVIPWLAGPPGRLGSQPPILLGIFDRRPWEGQPGTRDLVWFRAQLRPVMGETLHVRAFCPPTAPLFGPGALNAAGLREPWNVCALSILVAGWEESDLGGINPPLVADPSDPFAVGSAAWYAARLAIIGPNLAPDLCWRNTVEVDAGSWAGGCRFVGLWAWAYWVGIGTPQAADVTLSVITRPVYEQGLSGPVTVTVPRFVPDGPIPVPLTPAVNVWFAGPMPNNGSASGLAVGIVNGGAAPIDSEVRWLAGPSPAPGLFVGPAVATAAQASLGTLVLAPRPGFSGVSFFAANTAPTGFPGGPVLLSVTGPG